MILPKLDGKGVPRNRALWIFALAFVAVIRLILTGDRDILALNAPYDEFWFVDAASRRVWGGEYNQMAFAQLPVYSLWLYFLHLLGIPARLAIDLAWLLGCGYLAYSLGCLTRRAWLAVLCFFFLAFHPYSLVIFDRSLAETFLAVVSAATLGAAIELWNCRDRHVSSRWRLALVVYVFGFALAFHTRKEGFVFLLPLIFLAFLSLFHKDLWWRTKGHSSLGISLLVAPSVSALALGIVLSGANLLSWGVFCRYELAAPSYLRAITALGEIDVGRTPNQITVTSKSRELAYQVSPTFRELKPFFEGEAGKSIAAYTSAFTGVPGEIGNGWFYWTLRDFAAQAGWHKSAKFAEEKYGAVAQEINEAFSTNRLKKRAFSISPLIDPDVGKWIGKLPGSFVRETRLVSELLPGSLDFPKENASPQQFAIFVRIVGRRNVIPQLSIAGWVIAPPGSQVGLAKDDGSIAWKALTGPQRPDVPGAFPFSESALGPTLPADLLFRAPDGGTGRVSIMSLKEGQVAEATGTFHATLGIDLLSGGAHKSRLTGLASIFLRDTVDFEWLWPILSMYRWIGFGFWIAFVIGVSLFKLARPAVSGAAVVALCAVTAILARSSVLALLDVSAWSAFQARYLLPALPEFACAGVIGLGLIFDAALVLVSSRADSPKKGNLFLRPLTFDTSASEKLEDR